MQPDVTVAFVQAIIANADRLGLTWGLRIGTIVDGDDPRAWAVTMDNDQKPTHGVVSMLGSLPVGTRVYVLSIPPAGKYAIGAASQVFESGSVSFTFTTQTSVTSAVLFNRPFLTIPKIATNINSSAGVVGNWFSRAFNVRKDGFTLWVTGPSATWGGVPVTWIAVP